LQKATENENGLDALNMEDQKDLQPKTQELIRIIRYLERQRPKDYVDVVAP